MYIKIMPVPTSNDIGTDLLDMDKANKWSNSGVVATCWTHLGTD